MEAEESFGWENNYLCAGKYNLALQAVIFHIIAMVSLTF